MEQYLKNLADNVLAEMRKRKLKHTIMCNRNTDLCYICLCQKLIDILLERVKQMAISMLQPSFNL